jgi:hypothetical protein
VFAILVVGATLIGVLLKTSRSSAWFVIAASVLGSLVASIAFAFVDAVLLGNPSRDARETLLRFGKSVDRLHAAIPVLEQSRENDVRAIKPKGAYGKDEWRNVLIEAQEELLLVGHALDKWCTDDIAPYFRSAIKRLTEGGRPVQLLMLSESGRPAAALRAKDYKPRLRKSLEELAAVYADLTDEAKQHLHVHMLKPTAQMPYMAVGNEHILITAPYPATTQSSDTMPALEVGAASNIAQAIREDIRDLVRQHAVVAPLNP